jgi:hypothetical protein
MKNIYQIIAILVITISLFSSCKKDDQFKSLQVFTTEVSKIAFYSAKVEGKIDVKGKANITEAGFCWRTQKDASIRDSKIKSIDVIGNYNNEEKTYSLTIDSLKTNQVYYVRSYAIYNGFVVYGNEKIFKTAEDLTPFWSFGENYKAVNIFLGYVDTMNALIFNNQDITADMGVIQFGGGLQAPKTYDVVASTMELKENQAQVSNLIIDRTYYNSTGGNDEKIYTEEVDGKIVVKFNNLTIKTNTTPSLENSFSGLLILEK